MKRIFSAGLIFLLAAGLCLLPACSGGDDDSKKGTSEGSTITREPVDMEGYKFTWATMWEWTNYPERGGSDYGDGRLDRYDQVMSDYNCTIEKVSLNADSFFELINSAVMAGEKYADFIEVDFMRYQVLMNNKSLYALSDIEGFDVGQEKYFDSMKDAYTQDGKVYGLQYQYPHAAVGNMLFFNKTLLGKYSQPDPYQLYADNNWTFEQFDKIARALTMDTNNDNEIDQWGIGTVHWHFNNYEKSLIFANGGSIIKKNDENKWQFSMLNTQEQNALNFIASLTIDGKAMAPLSTTSSQNDAIDYFTSGDVGFFSVSPEMIERINSDMKDEWGMIVMPKGPDASDYTQMDVSLRSWVMLNGNKNDAKKASIIFDAISDPVTMNLVEDKELYFDQYLNNTLNGDEKALEQLYLAMEKVVPDHSWGATAATNQLDTLLEACLRMGSMTPKTAMETVGPVFQGLLEGFFYPVEETGETTP